MGGEQTRELTISYIDRNEKGDKYYIGTYNSDGLIISLSINEPKFDEMFEAIKAGRTYQLTFRTPYSQLISVNPAVTHHTCGIITHIIDMAKIVSSLAGFYEIKVKDFDGREILLIDTDQKNTITIGQVYGIKYMKWYGYHHYKVTELELCGLIESNSGIVLDRSDKRLV